MLLGVVHIYNIGVGVSIKDNTSHGVYFIVRFSDPLIFVGVKTTNREKSGQCATVGVNTVYKN